MPVFGLGVYQISGRPAMEAVKFALGIGYRLIDTASLYGNENEVGVAIRDSGIPRKDLFVTTKLWNSDQGYDKALRAFDQSVKLLGLEYVDLYLIHWPVPSLRKESWDALAKLQKEGRCRAIGVSNYTVRHLEELLDHSDVVPSVNQVEFNPFLYQKELLDFCNEKGIQLEAWGPLTRGARLRHRVIVDMARRYSRSPAQIIIRWSLQRDVVVIPKSSKPERIRENSQVFDFEISRDDMTKMDFLSEDLHTGWDPTDEP
ncbi:MAG: aldo/keto reductase [Nitrososphaerales archaeon]|jgi:diketogulonate reductase-like aldo/keto reductase